MGTDASELSERSRRDSGAVTVEAALGICSIVAAFAVALAGMGVVIGQLRCTDAVTEAARLVARGDRERAAKAVRRIAPEGANLTVTVRGDEITAEVTAPSLGGIPGIHRLRATAFAVMEPGASGGSARSPGHVDEEVPR
ncbi:hypothetical protein FHX42_003925 [Saccharopolyspora lacisalsi]|uniref:TadE-like protein n=1 Tax=Halosaccharopolyspora lacisalsi TaxID=1000566 RepID=A0A839E1X4_9PSEU|nr:TadE family type IV pilus minor pilin [Halosaccharopolyspora lacisalsi]MBA8826546.1 hypothetical protein [Halosaccharopolyspora lacisalsi]